jgi:hypothetical protein
LFYYLRNTEFKNSFGKYVAIGFVDLLLFANYLSFYFLPKDDNLTSVAISALITYFVFAGIAFWVDKKRV